MRLLVGSFLAVLILIHWGRAAELLDMPLSLMRETDRSALAYALFGLLVLMAAPMIRAALARENLKEVCVYAAAAVGMAVIALTGSFTPLHLLCVFLVFILGCWHFGTLVCGDEGYRLRLYSLFALGPVYVAGWWSYGVGQKALILYYVLAMAVRHRDLCDAHAVQTTPLKFRPRSVSRPVRHVYVELSSARVPLAACPPVPADTDSEGSRNSGPTAS